MEPRENQFEKVSGVKRSLEILHRKSSDANQAERLGGYHLETLIEREAEGAGTVYRVRIVADQRTAVSYHRLAEEYYYVLAGSGTAVLDGTEYSLAVGDFLRLPPGVTHGFVAGADGLEMLDIHTPGCRPERDTYFVEEASS